MKALTIKNGAKGISVFIFILFFDMKINNNPTIVPSQKDITKENNPADKPRSQPIPKINLPSPRPINRPFEKYHKRAKGIESIGPANKSVQVGSIKIEVVSTNEKFTNKDKKEIKIKIYTSLSGIIL